MARATRFAARRGKVRCNRLCRNLASETNDSQTTELSKTLRALDCGEDSFHLTFVCCAAVSCSENVSNFGAYSAEVARNTIQDTSNLKEIDR